MTDAHGELWQLVLAYMRDHPSTSEPRGRDRARVDELLAELYVLGERPSIDDVRAALAEFGVAARWAEDVASRWRERLKHPTWRPRQRAERGAWVRPFHVPEALVREHGLRPIPDRLGDALEVAAREYMRRSAANPESAGTSDESAVYALTAGAVRLWSLIAGRGRRPVVAERAVVRADAQRQPRPDWTNAGRARERERLDR